MLIYNAINEDGHKTAYIIPAENDTFITISPDQSVGDPSELPKRAFALAQYMALAKTLETEEDYQKNKAVFDKLSLDIYGEPKETKPDAETPKLYENDENLPF